MFGVGSIPWSPLARGLLTRPLEKQSVRGDTDWFVSIQSQSHIMLTRSQVHLEVPARRNEGYCQTVRCPSLLDSPLRVMHVLT